jgi:hypothetical protein
VPLVIWSHNDSGSSQAVGRFYAHLLEASGHRLASARRNPLERQIMLVERWIELAAQGGGRFLVLVIDEAQGMSQREWLWLVELHSLLEKQRVRFVYFRLLRCISSMNHSAWRSQAAPTWPPASCSHRNPFSVCEVLTSLPMSRVAMTTVAYGLRA